VSRADELERRVAMLTARRDAARARDRKGERAQDLRRKIVLGALVLSQWPDHQPTAEWRAVLDHYLTRPHDRRLFGLFEAKALHGNSDSERDTRTRVT
jgi:hypothetical protein